MTKANNKKKGNKPKKEKNQSVSNKRTANANQEEKATTNCPPFVFRFLFFLLMLSYYALMLVYFKYEEAGLCGVYGSINFWSIAIFIGSFGILFGSQFLTNTSALLQFLPSLIYFAELFFVLYFKKPFFGFLPYDFSFENVNSWIDSTHFVWGFFIILLAFSWFKSIKFVEFLFSFLFVSGLTIVSKMYTPHYCLDKNGNEMELNINFSHRFWKNDILKPYEKHYDELKLDYLPSILILYFIGLLFTFFILKIFTFFGKKKKINPKKKHKNQKQNFNKPKKSTKPTMNKNKRRRMKKKQKVNKQPGMKKKPNKNKKNK
ncbi:transcription initiation factor tfiid subunit [Anaeramoeba flamelloides]|uniref:Transcription initiation factor tfiid subunit n=1 Tax=Anaeramoeba flamelloides TaxID=1746091 RepID=A0AAV7YQH8_9EUKA|nr:transcription initiation factor tfiid subunit [Anaeramoeba flamelloides]